MFMKNDDLPNNLEMFKWKVIVVVSPKTLCPVNNLQNSSGYDRYTLHTKINTWTISKHLQSKVFNQTK